jgi:hypothetical protein
MADLDYTEAAVAVVFPLKAEIHTGIAGEALEAGQVVYIDTTAGTYKIADANAAGLQQARGICLTSAGAGQAINILKKGHVAGYTLTSQSYDDQIFLSDTAGDLADAAGTMTVPVGRVVAMTDKAATKMLFVEFEWNVQWA